MQNFTIETLTNSIESKEKFDVYNTDFEGFNVLTFMHCNTNELFFIGKQCAEMLDYSDTDQTIRVNVSDEDKCKLEYDYCMELMKLISNEINELDDSSRNSFRPVSYTGLKENRDNSSNSLNSKENNGIYNFNKNGAIFISEEGLYDLILDSKKPEAKAFRKTVHKILKEIRQTGGYGLSKTSKELSQHDDKALSLISDSMATMAQLMNSNLTMDERIQNITKPMINNVVGSYSQALFLNPHSTVVANKTSTPTKNWSDDTTCWSAIVNLGVYAHTQRIKNNDVRKALYDRMDDFETSSKTYIDAVQIQILLKCNKKIDNTNTELAKLRSDHDKELTKLRTDHDEEIAKLRTDHDEEIAKLAHEGKVLNTEFKTVVLPNFDSLSEKINTLEEAISILKSSK